jgi:hypothetical protein
MPDERDIGEAFSDDKFRDKTCLVYRRVPIIGGLPRKSKSFQIERNRFVPFSKPWDHMLPGVGICSKPMKENEGSPYSSFLVV